MTDIFGHLLSFLFLKGCLLMNVYQIVHSSKITNTSQEKNFKSFVATNLQHCVGGAIYINATRCNKHVSLGRSTEGAKHIRTRLRLGAHYQKVYFICQKARFNGINKTSTTTPLKNWGCTSLNLSKSWFPQNNTGKNRVEHVMRNGCILLACITLLHTGNPNKQCAPYVFQRYYTSCEAYGVTEVAFSLCGFVLVLSLFALYHDAVLMRMAMFIVMICLSLALSEDSWMYLTYLLVFILLFIFTGAVTSARFTKLFIFFMQTYSAMFPMLTLDLSKLYTLLRFNSLHFITLPCIFPKSLIFSKNSSWNNLICSFCAPLVALFIIIFFTVLRKILRLHNRQLHEDISLNSQLKFALVFVAYYSFFNSSTLAFKTFRGCPSESVEYALAVFGLIVFGLLPIAVFTYLLYYYRHNLNDERVLSWLGYLYKSYRPDNQIAQQTRWQYYEICFMSFRVILAAILTLLTKDWKYFLVVAVLLIMAIFYYKVTPFADIFANFVALVPIISLIIINIILYIYVHRQHDTPGTVSIEPNLISIVFIVTLHFFVRIIAPGGCRQLCVAIRASCRCLRRRQNENTEASRRLITDGATREDGGYGSVRVIASIIDEYRGTEVVDEENGGSEQSHNCRQAEQTEEAN